MQQYISGMRAIYYGRHWCDCLQRQ